jgi:hypothetical protein
LPENNADGSRASVSTDQIRTKINEIVTKGGIGGGSIGTGDLPVDGSEGDLFYDETTASLYIYLGDPINAWVQTNGGGGGGGSIEVSGTAPTSPADGDLWFNTTDGQLYVYVASETAWFQTNGDGGGTAGGASVSTGDVAPATPADGDLWFNTVEAELYVYLDAEGAWIQTNGGGGVGSGNFSTGWVDTDGTNAVANGTTLTFDHNLGTEDLIVQVYMAKDASGTDSVEIGYINRVEGFDQQYGGIARDVTSTTIDVFLSEGWFSPRTGVGPFTGIWGTTYTHIKVVVSSGAGSGPRAYIAFDGTATDMAAELSGSNSLNVSSITDNGPGDYTIIFQSPVTDPIITIGHEWTSGNAPMDPSYRNVTSNGFDILVGESESPWPTNALDAILSVVVH